MADTRLIQFTMPVDRADECATILEEHAKDRWWRTETAEGAFAVFQGVVLASRVEALSDAMEAACAHEFHFTMVVLPVNALLPDRLAAQLEEEQKAQQPKEPQQETSVTGKVPLRISRAELRTSIAKGVAINRSFLAYAGIAALVAGIGLDRGDGAIIVGAMVIAPLLGPHMALALGMTLGDFELARKSLRATVVGGVITVIVALMYALVMPSPFEPSAELISRASVDYTSVALALASGIAGAFAYTSGAPSALVGVMVAVALVPPVVGSCIYFVHQRWAEGSGAALLFATNLVCVNFAGVVTFSLQGYSPRRWWEKSKARRAVRRSILLWSVMLLAILLIVTLVTLRSSDQPSASDDSSSDSALAPF